MLVLGTGIGICYSELADYRSIPNVEDLPVLDPKIHFQDWDGIGDMWLVFLNIDDPGSKGIDHIPHQLSHQQHSSPLYTLYFYTFPDGSGLFGRDERANSVQLELEIGLNFAINILIDNLLFIFLRKISTEGVFTSYLGVQMVELIGSNQRTNSWICKDK